jgi:hypothetical protein
MAAVTLAAVTPAAGQKKIVFPLNA